MTNIQRMVSKWFTKKVEQEKIQKLRFEDRKALVRKRASANKDYFRKINYHIS